MSARLSVRPLVRRGVAKQKKRDRIEKKAKKMEEKMHKSFRVLLLLSTDRVGRGGKAGGISRATVTRGMNADVRDK